MNAPLRKLPRSSPMKYHPDRLRADKGMEESLKESARST